MSAVALLGLGAMGRRLAARLAGVHDLVVYSRSGVAPPPGARAASTPREAAAGAEVVVSMVTDDPASREVWLDPEQGALLALGPGAVAVECSTVTPGWVAELGAAATERGVLAVDAPVVGSTPQAEQGQLVILAGGSPAGLERARPVLASWGSVVPTGALGTGAVAKLVVNALFASQVAVLAELLRAAAAHGVDGARLAEILGPLAVTSPGAKGALALMLAGDDAPRFPVRLVAKDLRYAVELGAGPVVDAVRARFEQALASGLGDANLTAVHKL